jgi:hypothetical protein
MLDSFEGRTLVCGRIVTVSNMDKWKRGLSASFAWILDAKLQRPSVKSFDEGPSDRPQVNRAIHLVLNNLTKDALKVSPHILRHYFAVLFTHTLDTPVHLWLIIVDKPQSRWNRTLL